ncbi:MAG: GNAT family N-acetyltransferase [Actinomycetota bacterium]|nr:GNAT family N-acetyltransferase [Actinomycetota bacterium]
MTHVEPFTVRPARPEEVPRIAALVVEGFMDKFRPVFGDRRELSVGIMEKWIGLEHSVGGVRSLVVESDGEIVASVGIRMEEAEEEAVARGLRRTLRRALGLPRTLWATTLLSYPRYFSRSSEAYVERLVVSPEHRKRGMARCLLENAESLARKAGKETIGLHVSGNNEAAIGLYEGESYVEVSRQRSFLTGHFLGIRDWLYMKKEF